MEPLVIDSNWIHYAGSDGKIYDRGEWKKSLLNMCDSFVFEGLELESEPPSAADEAHLTFRAHLVQKGAIKMVDEIETSKFVRDGERWLYASGDVEYEATKVGTLPA